MEFEDSLETTESIHFTLDKKNSGIIANRLPNGWTLKSFDLSSKTYTYPTTFGDPSLKPGTNDNFQRITATLTLKRIGLRIFATTFLAFFVATALIIIVFSINMSKRVLAVIPLQTRITLSGGNLFSVVGGIYGLTAKLPYTTHFTLADSIQITTFIGIALAILGSVLSEVLSKNNKEQFGIRVTQFTFIAFMLFHFVMKGYFLSLAIAST